MNIIDEFIIESANRKASDVHVNQHGQCYYRVDGSIELASTTVTSEDIMDFLSIHNLTIGPTIKSLDSALTVGDYRLRMNYYKSIKGQEFAFRILSDVIPKLEDLNMPTNINKILGMKKGLVLISGVTGSGKTTTVAALLNRISETRKEHILTIEQPIEYIYHGGICKISQREVGTHTPSFTQATIDAMREDPDIIFLGEMRDRDTMENAITLSETGHLVLATIHCRNVVEAVDRIVDTYPAEQQPQARTQVVNVLECVISQSLVKVVDGGRYCLQEIMYPTETIRNLLKEHKTIATIRDSMNAESGSLKLDASAILGIKNFGVDAYDMFTYLQGSGINKESFKNQCEKMGVSEEQISRLPEN